MPPHNSKEGYLQKCFSSAAGMLLKLHKIFDILQNIWLRFVFIIYKVQKVKL